jgi:hypothetical protein
MQQLQLRTASTQQAAPQPGDQRSSSVPAHIIDAALMAPQQQAPLQLLEQQPPRPPPSTGPDTPLLSKGAAAGTHYSPSLHSVSSWQQQQQQQQQQQASPSPVRTHAPAAARPDQLLVLPEGSLSLAGGGVEFMSSGACLVSISPAASPTARSSPGVPAWRNVHQSVPWSC